MSSRVKKLYSRLSCIYPQEGLSTQHAIQMQVLRRYHPISGFNEATEKKTRITIYSEKKIMKGKQSLPRKLSKRQNTKVFTLETFSSRPYSCVVRSFPKFLGQDTFVARTREARHGHAFDLKTKNNPYFCEKWSKTFFGRHGLHVTAKFVIRVLKEVDIIYVN